MQTRSLHPVPVADFLQYQRRHKEWWQKFIGCQVEHPLLGMGTVTKFTPGDANFLVEVEFANGDEGSESKRFNKTVFDYIDRVFVPQELVEAILGSLPASRRPPEPCFKVGQEVALAARPHERGIVIGEPIWAQEEWQYEIFISANERNYHRESDLVSSSADVSWVGLDELLRNLALVKLRQPLSDNLYALYGSRTKFEVYQFKPALKFLANPDQRLLIADEVGLGKTIEAGIIYLELQARLNLSRVLIVCPSKLSQKWQDEMKLRFDEEFEILDAGRVRRFVEQYNKSGGQSRLRGIVSLELLRRREFLETFVETQLHLDLVVIDEAHHCRNTTSNSYQIASVLSENADAMLLLTATPLQMGNEDLFNLLQILSPGEFDDSGAFLQRLEPNQHINRAARLLAAGAPQAARAEMLKVERTVSRRRFTGNPYYQELLETLEQPRLTREQLVASQRRLVDLNTLANVFTRTRKREIAEKVPVRQAFTLKVRFTEPEAEFYQRIIDYVRQEFVQLHGGSNVSAWVTITRERQAASCISAARERFAHLASEVDWSGDEAAMLDATGVDEWKDDDLKSSLYQQQRWYRQVAEMPFDNAVDSKFDLFWRTLEEILREEPQSKIIVFSYFRDTIDYLYRKLRERGVTATYMHGGVKVVDRTQVIDNFRDNPDIRVLVSSDVGSEGLDFQFCNTIFNYDLPWNPMRVEQRIGRIDRFGQESAKIRVYNMVIDDTVESRILMRLYERIGIFERAVGDIEAILGEEVRELSRTVYTSRLSAEDEIMLAEQAANNIIRRQQEMEEFEQKRLEFMGQEAIFSDLVEETISSGRYLSDVEVRGLVATFIRDAFPRAHLERNVEPVDGTYTLDVDHQLYEHMRNYVTSRKRGDQTAQSFLQYLKPAKLMPLTFSSEMASRRNLLQFITPRHPLTQAAFAYWKKDADLKTQMACVAVSSDEVRPGDYLFFVFELKAMGIEKTTRLVPVAVVMENGDVHTELSHQLLHLVQTESRSAGSGPNLDRAILAEAAESAKIYMTLRRDQIEAEIRRSNDALVNARMAGLTQSYEAKRARIEATLRKVDETRIVRMYEGRLRNLQARYEATREEIESLRTVSVSFGLVLQGYARVQAKTPDE